VVLGLTAVHVPTGQAYALLGRGPADEAAGAPPSRPAEPGDWPGVAAMAANDFEEVVCRAHPEVARALAAVRAGEPLLAMLSGSGGAVFAVHHDRAAAARARESAARTNPHTRFMVVDTLARLPEVSPAEP
jgi:4-diphosphocytidyl-2C-methyl-D-erythritol kinase